MITAIVVLVCVAGLIKGFMVATARKKQTSVVNPLLGLPPNLFINPMGRTIPIPSSVAGRIPKPPVPPPSRVMVEGRQPETSEDSRKRWEDEQRKQDDTELFGLMAAHAAYVANSDDYTPTATADDTPTYGGGNFGGAGAGSSYDEPSSSHSSYDSGSSYSSDTSSSDSGYSYDSGSSYDSSTSDSCSSSSD